MSDILPNSSPPASSFEPEPPVLAPRPMPRRPAKSLQSRAITLVKVIIAIVGIWFVGRMVRWNDTATLVANSEIRTVKFLDPVEVQVLHTDRIPASAPGALKRTTATIRFGRQAVHMEVAGKPVTEVVNVNSPTPDGPLGVPNEVTIPLTLLQPVNKLADSSAAADPNAERIQEGLRTLLGRAQSKWYLLLGAWALLSIPFFVTAIRWRNLMRPQGIDMPLGRCLQLTFVGQFYSIMLPGITGGDLVKIVYAARLTGSKTKSFITIILDRVIGLVALMVIAGTSAGIQLVLNMRAAGPAAAAAGKAAPGGTDNTLLNVFVMIVVLLAVLTVGCIVYFSRRLRRLVGIEWFTEHYGSGNGQELRHEKMEHLFRVVNVLLLFGSLVGGTAIAAIRWGLKLNWALHNWPVIYAALGLMALTLLGAAVGLILHARVVDRMTPLMVKLVEALVRVDETLHVYRGHFGLLFWAFIISLISQLTLPLSAWLSGMAFGMTAPITHYLAYVPVVVILASLPISPPQGLGVIDGFMLYFFSQRGVARASQAFALAQAVRFLPMLWNLVGAYWVVTGSYSRQQVEEQERELSAAGLPNP